MKPKKVTEYEFTSSIWKGNMLEEGEYISDGRVLFSIGHVRHNKLGLLQEVVEAQGTEPPTITQEHAWRLVQMEFDRSLKAHGAIEELEIGHSIPYYFFDGNHTPVAVDVAYLRFLCELLKTDRAASNRMGTHVGFYRGNEVVAVLAALVGCLDPKKGNHG